MQSRRLSSSLQPEVVLVCKRSKYSVRLSRKASVSKRGPFKQAHWVSFKRASDCGWEGAPLECLALSRNISACCEERVAVLRQDCFTSFLRWSWMEIRPARASIPLVGKVQHVPRIQKAVLHCIAVKRDTWALVGALAKNQSLKP